MHVTVAVHLALLPTAGFASDRAELATVVNSEAVYDASTYTTKCSERPGGMAPGCQKIASPDKPFPLPIYFVTTVRMIDGTLQPFRSENYYRPGVHIMVKYEKF